MRIGQNPLKERLTALNHKNHRVILPFWIPNITDKYFEEQPAVLDCCLESLTATINPDHTAITLINNASCQEAAMVARKYVDRGLIDKYVVRSQNRGKLETVLSEARAADEEFITISDADFLFFPGWEENIAGIMKCFPSAGMVSPFPAAHLAYFYNSNIIFERLKSGKIVDDLDIDLFEQGIGHMPESGLYSKPGVKKIEPWRVRHYYIEKNGCKALAGAVHALATYRREVVKGFSNKRVAHVFKNGYEHDYIDFAPEREGFLRLSTPQLLAYHLGNTTPGEIMETYRSKISQSLGFKRVEWDNQPSHQQLKKALFPITSLLFRASRKLRFI